MIKLTVGSRGMWYVGGGWSLCTMTSVRFAGESGHNRCLFCLIASLIYARQAMCGNVMFGACQLWRRKFCRLFSTNWACTLHSRLVRCIAAYCRHTVYDVGLVAAWPSRNTPARSLWRLSSHSPRQDGWDATRHMLYCRTGFQLLTSLCRHKWNVQFAAFITARATVCVIWYMITLRWNLDQMSTSWNSIIGYGLLISDARIFVNVVQLIEHRFTSLVGTNYTTVHTCTKTRHFRTKVQNPSRTLHTFWPESSQ